MILDHHKSYWEAQSRASDMSLRFLQIYTRLFEPSPITKLHQLPDRDLSQAAPNMVTQALNVPRGASTPYSIFVEVDVYSVSQN